MMLELVTPVEQRVRDLVEEFALSWQRTLALAIQLGDALTELKDELGHGRWLPWLESNFPLGVRMAQRFMDLAANASEMSYLPADTPITAALEWLAEQRREPKPLPEPNSRELEPLPLLRFCQADLPTATVVTLILRVAFPDAQTALDTTYGSGAFWDGSAHVQVTAHDARPERAPDGVADCAALDYADGTYDVVLFDPPHLSDQSQGAIMADRFGTLPSDQLPSLVREGAREAWRVARLGIVVKVTDHSHSGRFVVESDWVRSALEGVELYEVVHQVRSGALIDPKWEVPQLSAYNNGATYLIFRKDSPLHLRRPRKNGAT